MVFDVRVSVAIISYNSCATVVETLDSVLAQDYGAENIELVISDDGSKDATVSVIDEWLGKHSDAFSSVVFIRRESNSGVSVNCNSAWVACTCDWIKTIAADDILEVGCISKNVEYVRLHPECKAVFSRMEWFGAITKTTPESYDLGFFELDSVRQNEYLRYFSFNFAPTSFMCKSLLVDVGYADERYRMIEDLPLWLKVTGRGCRLHFLDCVTVRYRVGSSISKSSVRFVNIPFVKDLIALNRERKTGERGVFLLLKLEELLYLYSRIFIARICGNKKGIFSNALGWSVWVLMPTTFLFKAKRKLDIMRAGAGLK